MKRRLMAFGNVALFVLLVVSLVGCGGAQNATFTTHTGGPATGSGTGSTQSNAPATDYYRSGVTSGKDATGRELPSKGSVAAAPTSTTAAASGETPLLNAGGADSLSEAPSVAGSSDGFSTGKSFQQQYHSDLTAGQVDDNAKFAEYLDYLRNYSAGNVNTIDVSQRLFVRVVDGEQKPVAGALVQLFDAQRQVFEGRL